MHFKFYNEWDINKKYANITFFRVLFGIDDYSFTSEITVLNFCLQMVIGK